LLRSKLKTKVAIELMGTSGMRVGEAATLRVCDIQFGKADQPSKIMLKAKTTKSRKKRVTFKRLTVGRTPLIDVIGVEAQDLTYPQDIIIQKFRDNPIFAYANLPRRVNVGMENRSQHVRRGLSGGVV
jgi:integrase